ncbi:putative ribonuclease H-like domain-containing protein [Tanacetum coccineum]|uniref:Ribonuclease H-like domain-containing protein n=1 Tax=Tanacetum coccineum TaxID=301880 RepID=A0ABQ5GV11_9ASTR
MRGGVMDSCIDGKGKHTDVAFVSENTISTNDVSTAYGVSNLSGQNSQYEHASSYSLLANQSSCPQLDHEDLEQLDEFDLEEMDLKWQVTMISMRMKNFYKKTGRKIQFDAKEPVGFDKTKVKCYNCHKTGHFARECRTKGNQDSRRRDAWNFRNKDKYNRRRSGKLEDSKDLVTIDGEGVDWTNHSEEEENYALMACNSSGSDIEVQFCSNECVASYNKLKKLYDEQRAQLSQLWYEEKIRFMKIDLDDKTDVLTYHKKLLAEAEKEKEDLKAKVEKWHNSSKNLSLLQNSQMSANDKFGLGYGDHRYDGILSYENEVLQSVFMNKEINFENQPLYDRFVTAEGMHVVPTPMTGNYMPSGPDIEIDYSQFTYGPKQSQPSESETQTSDFDTCESNISIEILEIVSEPVVNEPNEQPSFASTNKQVKTPRETVKNQFTHSKNPKVDKKGLGYGFTIKACFVCGSLSHLIRDCDFHENRMAKQVELNKKMAVLTRIGKIPVSTARASGTNNVSTTRQNFNSQANCPHRALQNKGIVDSGCSRHMTGNKAYLAEYQDFNGGPVAFGGSKGYITGKGKIKTGKLDFEDVCFVKELHHFNLFSVSQMCDKKNKVLFTDTECLVLSPEFKLPDENQVLLRIPRQNNMYSFNLENIVPSGGLAYLIENATIDESNKYHKRLGHVNFKNLNKLVKGNLVRGTKENIDAGDSPIEAESAQDYFVLPIWSSYTSTVKSSTTGAAIAKQYKHSLILLAHQFVLPVLMSYSHIKDNSIIPSTLIPWRSTISSSNKKQSDQKFWCPMLFKSSKANNAGEEPTKHPDLMPVDKEDQERVSQETKDLLLKAGAAKASSTNIVNTASTPVSTTSPYGGLSFTDLTNTTQDDSEIPALEEIYDNPTDGIFTNSSYDDEGAVADFTNLEPIVNVSPIPTSRINSIHPLTLLLGDPQSAKVWILVDLPNGKKAIGTKWVYRNKKDERGVVVRNKARLVAQGHRQEEGIDYDEVFALVDRIEAIRIFLAFASYMGFIVYQMDVKSTFLYRKINEEVYVSQPPGFIDHKFPKKVYKVVKALYGLHQAPRAWYATLTTFLLRNGYRRGTIDKTLFIKKDKHDIILVQVYVDDIIFGSTKKSWCDEFEALMKSGFQMNSIGELTFFLGLQVKQKEDGIFISQDKYVAEILKKFDFVSVKTASTPIETQKPLVKDEEASDVDVHLYRSMIGSLMYLTTSRTDIMLAVCACSSDYAGANLDRKSTTGGCQFLGRRLISWQCKKQTIMATSTIEAEYVAAANCCRQVLWIQNQMLDYGFNFMNTKIYIDNEITICIVKNPVYHSKTKHVAIRHHFIRDAYKKKLIQVLKIHTDNNVVDLLTKAFDVSRDKDGIEALLLPNLFILALTIVSTDNAKLIPLGKDSTAIETLKKIPPMGKHFWGKVTPLFASMLVQSTEDEGATSERPSKPQPTPSPHHLSKANVEPQSDPSPRPSPTTHILDSILEDSGRNQGGQSSSDRSLSGNEGDMTLQSVYDLCISLCIQVTDQAKETKHLKAQIKKLKKKAKPVITHHRAWMKSVSLKQRLAGKKSLKKNWMQKEFVSKQGRKSAKAKPSVHKDPAFDELADDTLDYIETEDTQDVGRTRKVVSEEKETAGNGFSTEDAVSTDKEKVSTDKLKDSTDRSKVSTDKVKVSTDRPDEGTDDQTEGRSATPTTPTPTPTTFRDDETIAQVLIIISQNKEKLKEKEKGVELKDVEETEIPKPTSTRSLLTLKPLPKIDPKDKGKKKIEEEDESDTESDVIPEAEKKFKQLARDEEIARKVQEDWEAEEEVKKLAKEEAIKAALSNEYDFIQERIEVDRLLALRLQDEERERAFHCGRESKIPS